MNESSHQFFPAASIDCEQALIGAVIVNSEAFHLVSSIVSAGDFFERIHGDLWRVFERLIPDGKRIDLKLLISALGKRSETIIDGKTTASQYVARLAASATTVLNAPDYAAHIRDLSDQRKIAAIGDGLRQDDPCDPTELAAEGISALDAVVSRRSITGAPRVTAAQATVRAVDAVAQAYQRDGAIPGITWGLKDVDHRTLGIQRGELTIVAGRPGMGKTALAITVCRRASEAGNRTLFDSLEMGDVALTQRALSDAMFDCNRIPYWKLRAGLITPAEFNIYTAAAERLGTLPLVIDQDPNVTVAQIAARARQMKRKGGLDLLVVDHMHLVRATERYAGNRVSEVGEVSSGLKALAKELGIAVMALCQLSRQVEGRDDKRPTLGDLRWSGEIEQDADLVMMLYRPFYYLQRKEPQDGPGSEAYVKWQTEMDSAHEKLEAIIEKQRNGPIGKIDLFCSIECNAVRDKDYGSRPPTPVGDDIQGGLL